MSRNPIELFVEALPAAAAQAFRKDSVAVGHYRDEKPKPFPAATQLLTMLLVAEPSQGGGGNSNHPGKRTFTGGPLGAAAPVSGEIQHGHEQAVRAVLGEASEKAAAVLDGRQSPPASRQGPRLDSSQTSFAYGNRCGVEQYPVSTTVPRRLATGCRRHRHGSGNSFTRGERASTFPCWRMWKSMSLFSLANVGCLCAKLGS